jgi:hypothetical protein
MSGTIGAAIAVLDACLQNGYGQVTLDSVIIAANVATATKAAGHGFTAAGETHPVIRIAGATSSLLNGDYRITILSTTQFTFTTSGLADQLASGTITAKRAPAGFTKVFTGTNLAAYRSDDLTGTRLYLRLDDTGTTQATAIIYEVMTGITTGTGLAPTTGNVIVGKSASADNTARPWRLIADSKMLYLFINRTSGWTGGLCFGDINTYRSGDAYHCYICGGRYASDGLWLSAIHGETTSCYLSRAYTQCGSAIASSRYSHRRCDYSGVNGQESPNLVDNSVHLWPIEAWESNTRARGLMPGLYCPIHNSLPNDGVIINNVPGIGTVLIQNCYDNHRFGINITGPWR